MRIRPNRILLLWLNIAVMISLTFSARCAFATPDSKKEEPAAIGAIRHGGKHLAQPRPDYVHRWVRDHVAGSSEQSPKTRAGAFREQFARESSAWASQRVRAEAIQRESAVPATAAIGAAASGAVQPVSVSIFGLAVDFAGQDTFNAWAGTPCSQATVTASGPRRGEIQYPGPGDNNTIWYDPEKTVNANFYEKLIFGYEGVGRIRPDLKDPGDKQSGIDLSGYTLQDYFDHAAGKGNVFFHGRVEGWVSVDHCEAYYGADLCTTRHDAGGPATPYHLVADALQKFMDAHPKYYSETGESAFWKQFDADGDGVLDALMIIHAGMGQEAGGGAQGNFAIWSHASDLRNHPLWPSGFKVYEGDPSTTADDIVAGPYTMVPEDVGLGILVEELGHSIFGLPDLYTSDVDNSIGFWGPMSSGTWAGKLGSAIPVEMPLWLKMIARCGDKFCNWHEPVLRCSNTDYIPEAAIGKRETPAPGTYAGIRIDLPDVPGETTANYAGGGKGAYSGCDDDLDVTLDRDITVEASGKGVLTMSANWDIEEGYDYAYVIVRDETGWYSLMDIDRRFTTENPNGKNLGRGLTGKGDGTLRFNLAKYRGKTIKLRLRYKTDSSVTKAGLWVDNIKLDGVLIDNFSGASVPGSFPGWVSSSPGWIVVPSPAAHKNYYLLEWRGPTKYDSMLKTAYVTVYSSANVWRVKPTPYHIPGALLTYRNQKYADSYRLTPNLGKPPSFGPKYQLLVVDMNPNPMFLGDGGLELSPKTSSYDAPLTLDIVGPISLTKILLDGEVLNGPWLFRSKYAVKRFDDADAHYAGFYAGPPCPDGQICPKNGLYGSAVIPASGAYSARITHYDGTPYPELYGYWNEFITLGSGKPGDDGVQFGVRVNLLSKEADNLGGVLRINPPAEPDLILTEVKVPAESTPGAAIRIQTRIENIGFRDSGPFRMRAYLAPRKRPSARVRLECRYVSTVLKGGMVTKGIAASIPADTVPGEYILSVVLDVKHEVPEIDTTNNTVSRDIEIKKP